MKNLTRIYVIGILVLFSSKGMAYESVYNIESSFLCEMIKQEVSKDASRSQKYMMTSYDDKKLDMKVVFQKDSMLRNLFLEKGVAKVSASNEEFSYKAVYSIYGTYTLKLENLITGQIVKKYFDKDSAFQSVKLSNEDEPGSSLILNCFVKRNISKEEVF